MALVHISNLKTLIGYKASVIPHLYAEVVAPGSSEYEEARQLQAERFNRATMPGEAAYLQTVDFAPEHTLPIVVRRREPQVTSHHNKKSSGNSGPAVVDTIIGAARIEYAGSMITEEIIRYRSGSRAEDLLRRQAVAEIGGFATNFGLDVPDIMDVIDTINATIVRLAKLSDIDMLWVFPRRTLMSLLLADVPNLMPAYHFALCRDVLAWREDSERLQGVRDLRVKGLLARPEEYPVIYEIPTMQLEKDVVQRSAFFEQRRAAANFSLRARGAMREALHGVREELRVANEDAQRSSQQALHPDLVQNNHQTSSRTGTTSQAVQRTSTEGFLPFQHSQGKEADYLRSLMEMGGDTVAAYKDLSFTLLDPQPGMRVLDIGCGTGADLARLAQYVGSSGRVIGLDHDNNLVKEARATVKTLSLDNAFIVQGKAEQMSLPSHEFDRVRADRVLQHVPHPRLVLDEALRVLRPGGILTLVEPDWGAIALTPGGLDSDDDDSVLAAILTRYKERLAHATIGRQLYTLLHQQNKPSSLGWAKVQVRPIAFALTSWPVADAVLQLSASARALMEEHTHQRERMTKWLSRVQRAHNDGVFFASVPLFFAVARKADT